jgi:hypothetical protein
MDYSTRLLWKNKMHPEIYNANCDFNEKIKLQLTLDNKHNGNFKALLKDMLEYAILPDVEEYEIAVNIRDFLNNEL